MRKTSAATQGRPYHYPRLSGSGWPTSSIPCRRPHFDGRAAAASDHRGLRRNVAPPATPLSAGRRPRVRQDHHDGAAHQGSVVRWRPATLHDCLPGNLAEQWQDELDRRFHLPFEIMTNDKLESARTGNWFQENSLVICRLDKLSRDETLHPKLEQSDWDLVVCDEPTKCRLPSSRAK